MEINLVTSNKGKVAEFRHILEPQIKVKHVAMQYLELRADSNEEIAAESARRLAEQLKMPVVVEDSGLFINALNGFPGVCSAYIHKRIGLQGILKLLQGIADRSAYYYSAVAYAKPGESPMIFTGKEEGSIADEVRGSFGFGHDPFFVPANESRTYGEMPDVLDRKKFRAIAITKLKGFLQDGNRNR